VIRNVVMVKLRADADRDEVAAIQTGLRSMDLPGTLSYTLGDDLGLREGNWSFAIVADFADTDSYRAYDLDGGHNDLRARLAPLTEQISRVQFEVPGD
jgi:hypothetical protein